MVEDKEQSIQDEPIDEEIQHEIRRLSHHTALGRLSMDHGILTIVINPERDISFHGDGFALHEILGAMEFVKIRVQKAVMEMNEESPNEEIDWDKVSGSGKPS